MFTMYLLMFVVQIMRTQGYVQQQDNLFPSLSVWQTLMHAALLRLPNSYSYTEKMEMWTNIMTANYLCLCVYCVAP